MKKTLRTATAYAATAATLGFTLAPTGRAADDPAPPAAKPTSHLGKQVAAANLNLDPQALSLDNLRKAHLGYYPNGITLSDTKPAGIAREPAYVGTPHYGIVSVGNGPNKGTFIVVDDKAGGGGKLYIDSNRNGDLTDDGDSAFGKETTRDGNTYYGVTPRTLRASWADPKAPTVETGSGNYTLGLYYTVGGSRLFFYSQTARTGTLTLNGKQVPVLLSDSYSDGIFDRTAAPTSTEPGAAQRPVALYTNISVSDSQPAVDGVRPQRVDISKPFRLDDKVYEARVSADGSKIALYASDAKIPEPPKLPPAPALLAVGKQVPDFAVTTPDGKTLHLSDFKGKTVVLDFWATWCGPCQRSMPHLEGIYQQIKSRSDVTVLAVCVWDDRTPFDNWVKANEGTKYNFPVAFDLAARDNAKSIARDKFGVSGIPTQFVIDKDGKVAAVNVGYDDGDHRLEEALGKVGIAVTAPAESAKQSASAK